MLSEMKNLTNYCALLQLKSSPFSEAVFISYIVSCTNCIFPSFGYCGLVSKTQRKRSGKVIRYLTPSDASDLGQSQKTKLPRKGDLIVQDVSQPSSQVVIKPSAVLWFLNLYVEFFVFFFNNLFIFCEKPV